MYGQQPGMQPGMRPGMGQQPGMMQPGMMQSRESLPNSNTF